MTEPTGAAGRLESIRILGEHGLFRAAESLSRMLGCHVRLTGTTACGRASSALSAVGNDDRRAEGLLRVRIDGDGHGWALILLPISSLSRVVQALLGTPGEFRALTAIERSAVQEFGNVLVSSFLADLGDRLGRRVLPSPPELYLDDLRPRVREVLAWAQTLDSEVGMVHARLEAAERGIEAHVFVVLDVGALLMKRGPTGAQGVCI